MQYSKKTRHIEIQESAQVRKALKKVPKQVAVAYEIWANLVETHGVVALGKFPGYHDESLRGDWKHYRSSRLNRQWRIIYSLEKNESIDIISVERLTPHDYRKKK